MENEQIPAHEVQPLTRQETSAVLIHLNFPNALLPHQLTDLNSLDGVLRIRGTVSCSLRINAKYRNAQNFVFECKGFFLIPITLQHNGLVISGTNHLITNIDQLTEHNRIIYDAFKNDYAANNMGEKLTFISYEFSLENEILPAPVPVHPPRTWATTIFWAILLFNPLGLFIWFLVWIIRK